MIVKLIELTNSIGDSWFTWILASLVETSGLLLLIGISWMAIHKRVAPQVGYCLFLFVPFKLLLPLDITVPAATAQWSPSAIIVSWFQKHSESVDIKAATHFEIPEAETAAHESGLSKADIVNSLAQPLVPSTSSNISDLPMRAAPRTTIHPQADTTIPSAVKSSRLSAAGCTMIVWLLTVAFLLTRTFLTQLRFRKRIRQLETADQWASAIPTLNPTCDTHEPAIPVVPDQLRRRMGLTREVRVILSDDVPSPAVWGIIRPVIILPRGIASTLSSAQLQWVLLHELAHIRRFDLLILGCQRLAAVLHFFNPAIWISNRMIHRLREYACDDLALSLGDGTAVDSGEAFLLILRQATRTGHQFNGALGVFGLDSRSACFARVHRLMDTERPIHVRPGRLSVCGLILVAAILLPRIHASQNAAGQGLQQAEKQRVQPHPDETKPEQQSKPGADNKPGTDTDVILAKDVGNFALSITGPEGKGIADASIEIRTVPIPSEKQIILGKFVKRTATSAFVTANSDGKLELTIPENQNEFEITIVVPGFGPYQAHWSGNEDSQLVPAKFTAILDPAWSVEGAVVDNEAHPVEGVMIRFPMMQYKKRPGDQSRRIFDRTVTTDAAGKWRFDSVSTPLAVRLEFNHPDFTPFTNGFNRAGSRMENGKELLEVQTTLERGITVAGRITDETGNPIVGARIRTLSSQRLSREATSNDNGLYTLPGCSPQLSRIVVTAKDRAMDMKDVRVAAGMAPLDFVMHTGGKLRVRVIDEASNPIPKAQVVFRTWQGATIKYFEFDKINRYANDNGVWEWNEAPLDELQADICRPNGLCLAKQLLKARDEEYVFRVPSVFSVVGKVVDSQTKEPIKDFEVTIWNRSDTASPGASGRMVGRVAAKDGTYRIDQTEGLDNRLTANLIKIEAIGYRSTELREIKFDAGTATINFELTKAKVVQPNAITSDTRPSDGKDQFNKPPSLKAENDLSLPDACTTALKHNVRAFQTCSFKYSQRNEYPPNPDGTPERRPLLGDDGYCVLDGKQFFYRRIFPNWPELLRPDGRVRPNYEEYSFDGRVFYLGSAHLQPQLVTRYLGENPDDKRVQALTVHVGYLEPAGFRVPGTFLEWRTSELNSSILKNVNEGKILKLDEDSTFLTLELEIPEPSVVLAKKIDLEQMAKQTETRGDREYKDSQNRLIDFYRQAAAQDPVRRTKIKLDRKKGYAVVHQEDRTRDGKLIQTVDCEQLEFFAKTQIWLPRVCIIREFVRGQILLAGFTDQPTRTTTINLDEIAFVKPDDVSFKIDYGPGSMLTDFSTATSQPEGEN